MPLHVKVLRIVPFSSDVALALESDELGSSTFRLVQDRFRPLRESTLSSSYTELWAWSLKIYTSI